MRYQLRGDWPIGQFCIPVGTVIDTDASDQWSSLAKGRPPPLNAMPLNRETWKWMRGLYPGLTHQIVTPAGAER
jgi:hypothetical protein